MSLFIIDAIIVVIATIVISAVFYVLGAPDSAAYYADGAFAGAYLTWVWTRPAK